jgi:hypothetical protein
MKMRVPGIRDLLVLVVAILISSASIAQIGFNRNPGSIMPQWWNEYDYTPEVHMRARHIRMGNSGIHNSINGVLGTNNCDINLLFYSRSKTSMPKEELEECALYEYFIHRGITGEKLNLNDGFVKQEVVSRFSKAVLDRIEVFKNSEVFYFRAFAFELKPYDFKNSTFTLRIGFGISSDHRRTTYSFFSPDFEPVNSIASYSFSPPPEMSRRLESSRASNKILKTTNRVFFKVTGVNESPAEGKRILIDIQKFEFNYSDNSGNEYSLGLGGY